MFTFPKRFKGFSPWIFLFFLLFPDNKVWPAVDTFSVHKNSEELSILYYNNCDLDQTSEQFTRLIVGIHGAYRNAEGCYSRLLNAAALSGNAQDYTAIVAPNFITQDDLEERNLPEDFLFWYSSGWKQGNLSRSTSSHPRPFKISSFAIIDSIIFRALEHLPALEKITIVGHSAGGQFVNRYAAGNRINDWIEENYQIHFRYIVANPSSYLYLSPERRVENSYTEFAIPTNPPCNDYNYYKYGLENLNSYMEEAGTDGIIANYASREVIYLLGERDNDPNHSSLDKSCPAMLQGNHRLERGLVYFNFLIHFYGDTITPLHTLRVVPGVGHSSRGIYTSQCGKFFLFDYGSCPPSSLQEEIPNTPDVNLESFPNPFNQSCKIIVEVPFMITLDLEILDLSGQVVDQIFSHRELSPGRYEFTWESREHPSGLYLLRLSDRHTYSRIKKILLIK